MRVWAVISTVLLLALAVCGWLYVKQIKGELAAEKAKVSAYAEAIAIRQKSDAEQAKLRETAQALDNDLNTMEGGDAPLSPYLRSAAGKLWPK